MIFPPEICKRRPVVVLTPRLRRVNRLLTVVPLSTTAPNPAQLWHTKLTVNLPKPYDSPIVWLKGYPVYFRIIEIKQSPEGQPTGLMCHYGRLQSRIRRGLLQKRQDLSPISNMPRAGINSNFNQILWIRQYPSNILAIYF